MKYSDSFDAGTPHKKNPYIIGLPIEEPTQFFGRESLFYFIADNLQQKIKVILLHGQRRIGKSSVLKQIPLFFARVSPQNEFVFVQFDLQHRTTLSLSQVLYSLATEISDHLPDCLDQRDNDRLNLPTDEDLATELHIFSRDFLPQVFQILGDKSLVFLLDEFDVLSDNRTQPEENSFFEYFKNLIDQHERLFIIPVVGRRLDDLPNLLNVFRPVPYQEIGLLDELSVRRLITRPCMNLLEYDLDAIQAIRELSAGHPYFTQVICHAVFGQARSKDQSRVTRVDIESIVDQAIENAEGGLDWFWQGLPTREQVVFSAVAQAQEIAITNNEQVPEEPLNLLKSFGVQTDSLIEVAHQLAEKGFLDNTERRVKIELVRRWLVQRHRLQDEIQQLENLEQQDVDRLCQDATQLRQQGRRRNAIARYEQILEINPNHFSTIVALAEGYLEARDFDQAVELYTRAYQFDPISNKEGLLRALQASGQKLIDQREFIRAREQFNQVLEIEPDNKLAQAKLLDINQELAGDLVGTGQNSGFPLTSRFRSILRPSLAAVAGIIALVGFGVRWTIPCSAGEQKLLGVICVVDPSPISRGERILFPRTQNPERDRGIEAFKQGRYYEAAEFFQRSILHDRNDPELLIYYNNARAKVANPHLTLAVVVGANNADAANAQEILRGVAQAQNQFNEKGGLNGRLLEIAIANDDNQPDKAKQVAQELVKDSSVLGVIGHTSSDATYAAIPEYEKAGLAIISPTSTNTLLSNSVFFRTVPSNALAGKRLAEYALKKLSLKNVVIFHNPKSLYSNSMREEFTKAFESIGGKIVQNIDLTDPQLNVRAQVARIIYKPEYQAQAIVLFPAIEPQDISIALKIATANSEESTKNPKLKLIGGDALYNNTTLNDGGKAVEGLTLVVPWFRDAPQSKNFAQAAAKQWGGGISWRTATSYDATQAFIKAFSPNSSRTTVLQKLPQTNLSSSETSGASLQFHDRECQCQLTLVKVKNGQFVYLNLN